MHIINYHSFIPAYLKNGLTGRKTPSYLLTYLENGLSFPSGLHQAQRKEVHTSMSHLLDPRTVPKECKKEKAYGMHL